MSGSRPQPQLTPGLRTALIATLTGCLAACNPGAAPEDAARDPSDARVQAADPGPATPPPEPPVRLLIEVQRSAEFPDPELLQSGGEAPLPPLLLSVDLSNAPLRAVLRELARELQLTVAIADGVPERRISLRLEETPVADAIRRILTDIPYELVYRDAAAGTGDQQHRLVASDETLVEIRVFAKGGAGTRQARALKPLDTDRPKAQLEAWRTTAIEGRDPRERLTALKQFLKHADPNDQPAVLSRALQDEAPEIRVLTLNAIGGSFSPPLETVSDLALTDENPQVRTTALDVLLSRYGAAAIPTFERALNDPDSGVQGTARRDLDMMQRLDKLLRPPVR